MTRKPDDWSPPNGDGPADASDLFGYPSPPRVVCHGCGLRSEPYPADGPLCWLCTHTGKVARDRRGRAA